MARVRRVDCSAPGIRRVRRGRGFSYQETDGTTIADREVIERINELAIPPAWTDVWICSHPRGHIQATGIDARGRKQYRYHDDWRANRDRAKFESMEKFAKALPRMREQTEADLARPEVDRSRALACAVRLLDLGFFRIGSERYAAENETFGLATLLKEHLTIDDGAAIFEYVAKGSKDHEQVIEDPSVVPTLTLLKRRRGGDAELLAFKQGRRWVDIKAADINDYLKEVMGGDYTAKDFRTWNATVLAAVDLAEHGRGAKTKTAHKRAASAATKRVAEYLSNTPAVCRSAYIDPRVFDRFDAGETIYPALRRIVNGSGPNEFPDRERIERAVLRLLS